MDNPIDLPLVFVGDFDSSFIEKITEMSEIAGQKGSPIRLVIELPQP